MISSTVEQVYTSLKTILEFLHNCLTEKDLRSLCNSVLASAFRASVKSPSNSLSLCFPSGSSIRHVLFPTTTSFPAMVAKRAPSFYRLFIPCFMLSVWYHFLSEMLSYWFNFFPLPRCIFHQKMLQADLNFHDHRSVHQLWYKLNSARSKNKDRFCNICRRLLTDCFDPYQCSAGSDIRNLCPAKNLLVGKLKARG